MIYSGFENTRTEIICNIQIRLFIQLRTIATCPLSPQETVWQFVTYTGFPFDFAQGGEPVEPRNSSGMTGSANCDIVSKGRTGFCGVKLMVVLGIEGFRDR